MMNTTLFANRYQVRCNAIGSIESETVVTLAGGKKNSMQGRITKRTKGGSVMFFGNSKSNGYKNMKQRKADKSYGAGNILIELKQRPWGERINNTPLITHKGNVYVECVYLKAPKSEYFLDGSPIEKRLVEGLKPSKPSSGNDVVLRTLKLNSITRLKMGALSA